MMMHLSALLPPTFKQTFSRPASNPTLTAAPSLHTIPLTADTFKPSNKVQRDGITTAISNKVFLSHIEGFAREAITRRLEEIELGFEREFQVGLLQNNFSPAEGVFNVILETFDPLDPQRALGALDSLGMLDQVPEVIPYRAWKLKRGLETELVNYADSKRGMTLSEENAYKSNCLNGYSVLNYLFLLQ
jgi:hypothetical protein